MPSENHVISNFEVLSADYLPNRMIHRDNERKEIANNLKPVLNDKEPRNILIHGPPGTGKTTMAKFVVEKLKRHDSTVLSGSVNCWKYPSRFKVYYQLLQQMGEKMLHRSGTPTDELVDKFQNKIIKRPSIIILDEVDQIEDERILYDMARYSKMGLIMIANHQNIFYDFDTRIRSSLSSRKDIRFKRYNKKQLVDILKDRRKWGLKNDVITNAQLKIIASNSDGDARIAINTLRIAAENAEEQSLETIENNHINDASPQAQKENLEKSKNKLNKDQQVLYEVIEDNGSVKPRELYSKYRERVENPKVNRTLRKYLSKMTDYNLIGSRGERKGREYFLED